MKTKNAMVFARVTEAQKEKFVKKASAFGNPSAVLRELVAALTEGRIKVSRPKKTVNDLKEKFYDN